MTPCRVADCTAPSDTFLCNAHARDLERALGDLPALVAEVVATVVGQTKVYRAARRTPETAPDWRGDVEALEPTPDPVNLDASDLLDSARNTLTTWARHIAGSRSVELDPVRVPAGPTCPPHQHDYRPAGCGHQPDRCKQMHPGHVHDMRPKGCGLDTNPQTGEPLCTKLHCTHDSCRKIRKEQQTGVAAQLAQWFIRRLDSIRLDEAAGEMHREIVALRGSLRRAIDRSPSRLYAGPCHADVEHAISEERDGTVYTRRLPRCQRGLYYLPGAKKIVCDGFKSDDPEDGGCGKVHTLASRKAWFMAAVEDHMLPLSDIQATFPKVFSHLAWPTRSTWWRWIQAGRLQARTVDQGGIELYRGGDAVELVKAEQKRIRANAAKAGRMTA